MDRKFLQMGISRLGRSKTRRSFQERAGALPHDERRRRKRELILSIAIILTITLLTFAEYRVIHFGADFPVSNTILMFILININLLLLILLIFLVFRNLVKLLYDRRRRVMGSRLRTRLVVAFIALTLLPTTVLFFVSISFITTSLEFWFKVPVEQALERSLLVGRRFYRHIGDENKFYLERIAYQIKARKLIEPSRDKELSRYLQIAQRSFNLHGVEVYAPNASRMSMAMAQELSSLPMGVVPADHLQKKLDPEGVRTYSEKVFYGELVRTVGTVPFGSSYPEAEAFIILTVFIPSDLSENMDFISRGFEEYQQIKLLKKPIQITYLITLSIVALLVLFCAIWFGFYLAKTITIPLKDLADGTLRVAGGDLGFTIEPVADDEIGSLVTSFNQMTRDLRISREQLELSARKLQEQNAEIEERRRYTEIVLKNVSAGVITLDAAGCITTINKSAQRMLHLMPEQVLNRSYRTLLKGQHLDFVGEIMGGLAASQTDAVEFPLRLSVEGRIRSFLTHLNALKDDAGKPMGIVMVFDDLTDLEKAQRMAAWREVARRIAHEVKNPLTPISLSAQRLQRKYSEQIDNPVFDECTQTIIDHVDLIRNLVNEFSSFARFPTANLQPGDLLPIVEETIALYREGLPDVSFDLHVPDVIPQINLDRRQIKQALINLVDNAISAVKEKGAISIALAYDPILRRVRIEVADDGQGISDEDKTRLFEPYFSTKKAGMGLGLTIVNTIVADHNGMIRVQDNQPRGAKFVIELPV
jgi:two-component system nitrogen regulation sensor histidine kinase NtrY